MRLPSSGRCITGERRAVGVESELRELQIGLPAFVALPIPDDKERSLRMKKYLPAATLTLASWGVRAEVTPHHVGDTAYIEGGIFICPDIQYLEPLRESGMRKDSDPAPSPFDLNIDEYTTFKIDFLRPSPFESDRDLGEADVCGTLADGRHFCTLSQSLLARSDVSWNQEFRNWLTGHGSE